MKQTTGKYRPPSGIRIFKPKGLWWVLESRYDEEHKEWRPVNRKLSENPTDDVRQTEEEEVEGRLKIYFNSNSGGRSPGGSTRHVRHYLTYCTNPGWLWWWKIWWNDDWQWKLKYSEKACPSATLSTGNPTWPDRPLTRATAVGSERLTAWAMARHNLPLKFRCRK
jgi:hypothetical protein